MIISIVLTVLGLHIRETWSQGQVPDPTLDPPCSSLRAFQTPGLHFPAYISERTDDCSRVPEAHGARGLCGNWSEGRTTWEDSKKRMLWWKPEASDPLTPDRLERAWFSHGNTSRLERVIRKLSNPGICAVGAGRGVTSGAWCADTPVLSAALSLSSNALKSRETHERVFSFSFLSVCHRLIYFSYRRQRACTTFCDWGLHDTRPRNSVWTVVMAFPE